jgi:hypothetical protein
MPLHQYNINLGDIDVKGPIKTPQIEPSKTADKKRKLSREIKRYFIEMLLKESPPIHDKWACDYQVRANIGNFPLAVSSELMTRVATQGTYV